MAKKAGDSGEASISVRPFFLNRGKGLRASRPSRMDEFDTRECNRNLI